MDRRLRARGAGIDHRIWHVTTDAAKEYFESVRFEISEAEWDVMGQRRVADREDSTDVWEASLSENPDDCCAVCGRSFDPSPFVMHEC